MSQSLDGEGEGRLIDVVQSSLGQRLFFVRVFSASREIPTFFGVTTVFAGFGTGILRMEVDFFILECWVLFRNFLVLLSFHAIQGNCVVLHYWSGRSYVIGDTKKGVTVTSDGYGRINFCCKVFLCFSLIRFLPKNEDFDKN